MVIAPVPLLDWKAIFRKRAKAAREAAAAQQSSAANFAATHFMSHFAPKDRATIALYYPHRDELDTWPLTDALMADGHAIVLPVVEGKKQPLTFRLFEVGMTLEDGAYGIKTPPATAETRRPDILVVPLLAVRRDGARLGTGGGYYDRTLSSLRGSGTVTAVGYGYAAQKMERFPVGEHDEFLDGFVSEQGAEQFERRR